MEDTTTIAPAPAIVADDAIRRKVAGAVLFNDGLTCLAVLLLLFYYGNTLSKDILAIAATIIGSIVGYRARDTGTVIGYLFGSSSGSTAKSALLETKGAVPTVAVTPQPGTATTTTTTTEPKI